MKKRAKICFYIFVICAFCALGILGYFVFNDNGDNVMVGSRKFVTFNEVPGATSYSVSVKDSESLEYSDYVANYKVTKPATTTPPTTKPEPTTSGRTIVSVEIYEDCDGSGHGVKVITYSDGTQEEVPF
jgi:hypothetical protein